MEPTGRAGTVGAAARASQRGSGKCENSESGNTAGLLHSNSLGTEILYCPKGGSANYQEIYTPFLIHCGLPICCIMKSATSAREMRLPLGGRASPSMR